MNWKLIFQLSVFGLIMSVASVFLIPETIEPGFWIAIFLFCAYAIARMCREKYFLHGFFISIVNSIWITIAHVLYASTYLANHPQMVSMNLQMPLIMQQHQRTTMAVLGLPFGAVFGLILGLFCFIASKIVKKS